jgi:maltose alpha-D-glucosyltransferase / alpha-amylase
LLNWMTALIRLRKECPEIGWGDWQILDTGVNEILGICYSWRGNSLLVLHNFDEKPHEVTLSLKQEKEAKLVDLMANYESKANEKGSHHITLDAYGYRWFRAGDLSHLLHRKQ